MFTFFKKEASGMELSKIVKEQVDVLCRQKNMSSSDVSVFVVVSWK